MTGVIRNPMSDRPVVPLTKTLLPLFVAPLVGAAVLAFGLPHSTAPLPPSHLTPTIGPTLSAPTLLLAVFVGIKVLPFCDSAAAVFVFPILALFPKLRRPNYLLAVLWGIVAAFGATFVLGLVVGGESPLHWVAHFAGAILHDAATLTTTVAGGLSGLVYAVLVRWATGEAF
jgi:hypothetical protein